MHKPPQSRRKSETKPTTQRRTVSAKREAEPGAKPGVLQDSDLLAIPLLPKPTSTEGEIVRDKPTATPGRRGETVTQRAESHKSRDNEGPRRSLDEAKQPVQLQSVAALKVLSKTSSAVQAMPNSVIQRQPIDLSDATVVKTGPPATLCLEDYYYKLFGTKAQAEAMKAEWDDADTAGVVTPSHKVVQVSRNGQTQWAFRSKGVTGTFFQFSKGHTNRVVNWIKLQTSRSSLGRLRKLFVYVRSNIGDSQGFFDNVDGGKIWFIDINMGGTTPNAEDVVTAIDDRLKKL